ncbi:MAG TPA: GAF domain-containing protein, partial [candidate division Zixibacteria bacterium]|nr:GAF domain-containing protein [candidate division Zixibacteria bacterium]
VLNETARLLKENFPKYNWVGFYLMEGNELALGPYLGKPTPHTRIKLDSGICGAAVREEQTIIVPDVKYDPRYLACSLETKSEIVVPIRKGEKVVGEIDIDSDELNAFDEQDKSFLETVSEILSDCF